MTRQEFRRYADLLYSKTGIYLHYHKFSLVENRLARLVGPDRPFHSHEEFLGLLESRKPHRWLDDLTNVLTTNFSFFFRDPVHFDTLAWYLRERGPVSPALRFWSAASSTGEEAYSMAITLERHRGLLPADTKILATDISTKVLATAQRGLYPAQAVREAVHEPLRWFERRDDSYAIRPEVRSWVTFGHLNLHDPLPLTRPVDIVFLRNVLIYFDKASKEDVLDRVYEVIRNGGLLVIGLSESLVEVKHRFRMLKNSIYQKILR